MFSTCLCALGGCRKLREDLEILRTSGLRTVSVFWLETREAVTGGFK